MSDAKAMQIFLDSPVTQDMIHHLVSVTLQVLNCDPSKTIKQALPSPPNSPVKYEDKPLPSLMTFITKLVRYTNVYTGTLMATIVYMNRLKQRLPKDAKGLPCTRHRLFLACLIISSKNFNDCSPKNKHWAKYTDGLFKKDDVNLMEKQLLMLLDWDVKIETTELSRVWKRFLDPIKQSLKNKVNIRDNISKGMLMGSTQTIVCPPRNGGNQLERSHSRASSVSSNSTITLDSLHSRSSSVSSFGSITQNDNVLKDSCDQLNNALASLTKNTPLNNYLKSVAMKEDQELDALLRQYCSY